MFPPPTAYDIRLIARDFIQLYVQNSKSYYEVFSSFWAEQHSLTYILPILTEIAYIPNAKKCNCIQVLAYCRILAKRRRQVQVYRSEEAVYFGKTNVHIWYGGCAHKTTMSLYNFVV